MITTFKNQQFCKQKSNLKHCCCWLTSLQNHTHNVQQRLRKFASNLGWQKQRGSTIKMIPQGNILILEQLSSWEFNIRDAYYSFVNHIWKQVKYSVSSLMKLGVPDTQLLLRQSRYTADGKHCEGTKNDQQNWLLFELGRIHLPLNKTLTEL